jgi:hypothetical protein
MTDKTTKWQKIQTAPHDEEVLLAIPWRGSFEVCQGISINHEWFYWGDQSLEATQPLYWAPLPKFVLPEVERMFADG